MDILAAILAIVALGFLIAIHEAGHMMMARRMGMRVLRYSVGFGPVIWRKTRGETTYQLAAIPFGGFVEIDGMNPEEEHDDPDDPRLYDNRPVWARALTIAAGPLTNYAFAFIVAAVLFGIMGQPRSSSQGSEPYDLVFEKINAGAAREAGIKAGDVLTHIDGYSVRHLNEYRGVLQVFRLGYRHQPNAEKRAKLRNLNLRILRGGVVLDATTLAAPKTGALSLQLEDAPKKGGATVTGLVGKPLPKGLRKGDIVVRAAGRDIEGMSDLTIHATLAAEGFGWAGKKRRYRLQFKLRRGSDSVTLPVTPERETGAIGVYFREGLTWKRRGVMTDAWAGLAYPIRKSREMLGALGKLFGGDKRVASSATGPVGIVAEVKRRITAGLDQALVVVILLSTLLGMFNLLPVPALDGGRIFFLGIESVARRRLSPALEARVHLVGFFILLGLLLLLTYRDLKRIFF